MDNRQQVRAVAKKNSNRNTAIFSAASPSCMTGQQRHVFFHVVPARGSTRCATSLLMPPDMKAHTDTRCHTVCYWIRQNTKRLQSHGGPSKWCLPLTYFRFSQLSHHSSGAGVGSGRSSITKVQLLPAVSWSNRGREGDTETEGSGSDEFQSRVTKAACVHVCEEGGQIREGLRERDSAEGGWAVRVRER